MKIGLIAGGYPPDLDGIGDYTFCLARALSEQADVAPPVTVYTRKGKHEQAPGVRVSPFFEFARPSSIRDVLPLVAEDKPDWLVLQYNPFCWGARGFCPALPPTLRRLKRLPYGPKLAVMFHETTVPKWPWRFALMYAWQRPILRAVAAQADRIFVSTKRWLPELAYSASRAAASVLPVGSNIPRSALAKAAARHSLGISEDCLVLAVFGGAHPSRLIAWIAEAARAVYSANRSMLVLHVGPEGEVLAKAVEGVPFKSVGILPAQDVGDTLRAADGLLSPFIDGISTRRTSAIAALNNGVPVATTIRDWSDDWFASADDDAVLASSAGSSAVYAGEVVSWAKPIGEARALSVQREHDTNFAWPSIAERMVEGLR